MIEHVVVCQNEIDLLAQQMVTTAGNLVHKLWRCKVQELPGKLATLVLLGNVGRKSLQVFLQVLFGRRVGQEQPPDVQVVAHVQYAIDEALFLILEADGIFCFLYQVLQPDIVDVELVEDVVQELAIVIVSNDGSLRDLPGTLHMIHNIHGLGKRGLRIYVLARSNSITAET